MSSGKLNDWLQVVGLFAVVGSLIFVGLQMRQEQRIALSQIYQERADQSIAITLAALESDTALSFWGKTRGYVQEGYSPAESAFGLQWTTAMLSYWENNHYQYVEGFVSEEQWQTQLALMKTLMPMPAFRYAFEQNKNIWRASFREVLEGILKDNG